MNRSYVKKYILRSLKIGLMAASGGPIIYAIVIACINKAENIGSIPVGDLVLGILTSALLAFIAGAISVVHSIESLPKPIAALIQFAVLYADYAVIYLVNGWIDKSMLLLFTLIFVAGFIVVWLIVVLAIKSSTRKMNEKLQEKN